MTSGPEFILRSYAGGAFPTQLSAPMLDSDLTFTLAGPFQNWPTGSEGPGPFTLAVDDGLPTVEKILCSALDISTGVVTVYVDGDFTGRGYDGTTPNGHTPQAAPAPQCRPCWTAEEAMEANLCVNAVMEGASGAPNGYVLTAESGGPSWQPPGGEAGGLVPIGSLLPYAGATAPTGFHLCDGSAISRTTYATLFAAIGTTWGDGDGSTTFNIPNFAEKFPVGASTGFFALGASAGSFNIGVTNLPSHNHGVTDPGHEHLTYIAEVGTTDQGVFTVASGGSTWLATSGDIAVSYSASNHWQSATTGISTQDTGDGDGYTQPYNAVNFIIRIQ